MRLEEGITYLTSDELAAVDRAAAEVFGLGIPDLMGKAGLDREAVAERLN